MKLCQIRGTLEVDLFNSRVSHQLPHYISWKIYRFSQSRDAFQMSWARKFVYAFPHCSHRKGSSESKSGSVSDAHNNPSMARPTMVSRVFKNVSKKSAAFTSTQRSTERPYRKVESTRNTKFTGTSCLDNLRQNLLAEGISERASNLSTNNGRTSSTKHCESAWKKWCGCSSEREISSTRLNINYVLDFSAELFEKGLKYRTIGTTSLRYLRFMTRLRTFE